MKELSLFEQELNEMGVIIIEDENLGLCASYKSLHEYCEIKTKKVDYFTRSVAKYFNEDKDYALLKIEKRVKGNNNGGSIIEHDYLLTLDCAKHVALMSKTQ